MVIAGYNAGPLLKKTAKEVLDDNVLGLAAQTAYYFFFSLFPLFLFAAPLLAVVGNKRETFSLLMGQLASSVPGEAFAIIRNVLSDVVFSPNAPGIMSVGALLAAWAGSNIFSALMDALNIAYDVSHDERPWWKKKLIALCAVVVAGVILVAATVIMLAGEKIVGWVANLVGLGSTARVVWLVIQYPLAIALLTGLAWLVFWFLPNVRQNKKHVLVGALVTTILWLVVTLIFRLYVQHFGSYNKTYGAIGGVIVLLTWMYLSMLVVLIGGELNSELHHGTGATATRGGTLYADRLSAGGIPVTPSTDRVERLNPASVRRP